MNLMSYGKYYGDLEALEDLQNRTICVREGNGIRNVRSEDDYVNEELVAVKNIFPVAEKESTVIPKGKMVRYKKVAKV